LLFLSAAWVEAVHLPAKGSIVISRTSDDRTSVDILDSMSQVLDEAIPSRHSRRSLMVKAGGLLMAGGALTLPGVASAASGSESILSVLTTFEHFGVTLLTNAARQAPGTPSAKFANVLEAANLTEFFHIQALQKLGGKTLTTKFWIPDAVLDGSVGLFNAIGLQEAVEISAYLVGVTHATQKRNAFQSRLFAEALGTECEHRVLARSAAAILTGSTAAPNNVGFEAFPHRSGSAALKASEKLGLGFGKQGATPGKFYEYPGDPRKTGTALAVSEPRPS
jgi:hypothetical protein